MSVVSRTSFIKQKQNENKQSDCWPSSAPASQLVGRARADIEHPDGRTVLGVEEGPVGKKNSISVLTYRKNILS